MVGGDRWLAYALYTLHWAERNCVQFNTHNNTLHIKAHYLESQTTIISKSSLKYKNYKANNLIKYTHTNKQICGLIYI